MEFSKEFLRDIVYKEYDEDKIEVMMNEIIDTSRWTVNYYLVFKFDGKYYETGYQRGATEIQDEHPFEYEPDMIKCTEVEPIEVTMIRYRSVKKGLG